MNFLLRTILPFFLLLPLSAQQSSPTASVPPTLQLNVAVAGRSGKLVSGLQQSNFSVLDNGSPLPILNFRAVQAPSSDPPTQIILLIDTVNTSLPSVSFERNQIAQFLRKSGPTLAYPLSFIFFSDRGTEIQQAPSRNTAELLAELDQQVVGLHTIRRSSGFYGAAERVQLSLKTLGQIAAVEQKTPGRKLLVWISPGWPYLSGPRITITARDESEIFSSIVGLSTALQRADITLYSVDPIGVADGLFRTTYYKNFLKAVTRPNDAQSGNLALQVLAEHTGGKVLHSGNDIAGEIADCIDDASAFYILTVPRAPADSADNFHSIRVKLPDTSLKARTLNGYYARP
jgi:VWFA-related protein